MKIDNVEEYEYNLLNQMFEFYQNTVKKNKGVDPDFPGMTLKFK